jgi:hypothetical protein
MRGKYMQTNDFLEAEVRMGLSFGKVCTKSNICSRKELCIRLEMEGPHNFGMMYDSLHLL